MLTWTNEPFQPVRFYYSISSRPFVLGRLTALRCIEEERTRGCWQWLYQAEAAALKFERSYEDVPEEVRPIILGRIRFPKSGGMTIDLTSILRAIEGARFFRPILGPKVVLRRVRIVNRWFSGEDNDPADPWAPMKELDRNVTVVDPAKAERELKEDLKGVRTQKQFERALSARMKRTLASKEDVPLVEDFPLAPEEETPEFRHLATTLELRLIRALEHWRGNTDLTLAAIIVRSVKQTGQGSSIF